MNFEQLYTEHYKSVYYTCYKYLQNEEDAKDMAQNVFIKAFDRIDSLKETNSFKSWISRIAANECINELKKSNRLKLEELTATNADGESFEYLEDESQKNPEELMVEDDVRDILLDIINRLPQDQQIAVHLYYYQDMTVKEISKIFNCSEQTTRNRLGYARKNIKKEIDKLEDKGVQLRSISLLPFLYLLFQAEESYAQVAIPEYASLTIAQGGATTTTEAGATTSLTSGTTASSTTSVATTTVSAATTSATKTAMLFGLNMKAIIIAFISIVTIAIAVAVIVPKGEKESESDKTTSNESTSNNSDSTDDENVNTDADESWGTVIKDKKIDLSHTFLGSHKDSHILYSSYQSETEQDNGDYYVIPLNDKYNSFSAPLYVEEGADYFIEREFTEPGELHFEYDENYTYRSLTGPVYVVKKETASDVIANKEYLTPEANIDLGEVLINGHTLSIPSKAAALTEIGTGDSLFISDGTKIDKYLDSPYHIDNGEEALNLQDSNIMLEPEEIIIASNLCRYNQPKIDGHNVSGLLQLDYIIYNDSDKELALNECTIYGVSTSVIQLVSAGSQYIWPQVCLPGYVSHSASQEYVMKQYGMPIASDIAFPESQFVFEGDRYCCALTTKLECIPSLQFGCITYFMLDEKVKSFVREAYIF